MTHIELMQLFNTKFGLGKWPDTYIVDAITYGNVCYEILHLATKLYDSGEGNLDKKHKFISLFVGKNGGILFKDVELLLGERSHD